VAPTVYFLLSSLYTTSCLVAVLVLLAAYEFQCLLPYLVSGPGPQELPLPIPIRTWPTYLRSLLVAGGIFVRQDWYHIFIIVFVIILPNIVYHPNATTTAQSHQSIFLRMALEGAGYVWIGVGMTYSVQIYADFGASACTLVLLGNWLNDAGALIAGKICSSLGMSRAKLLPSISPSKTVEGAVAGVLLNALVVALGAGPSRVTRSLAVGLFLGSLGVVGDLIESLVKRTAGVKDTGGVFPGHGGVLDRIDGLLIVYPVAYALIRIGVWVV